MVASEETGEGDSEAIEEVTDSRTDAEDAAAVDVNDGVDRLLNEGLEDVAASDDDDDRVKVDRSIDDSRTVVEREAPTVVLDSAADVLDELELTEPTADDDTAMEELADELA
ncbi:hypothetical protein ACN47E_000999 [Coniothyrium glycines]